MSPDEVNGSYPAPGSDPTAGDRRWVGRVIVFIIVGPGLLAGVVVLSRWLFG